MSAKRILVYTTSWCPYCHLAKRLLDSKGVEYEEIDVESEPGLRAEVARRSGRTTVPQTFVDDEPLGGFDDLAALDGQGRLDEILGLSGDAEEATSSNRK